MAIGRRAAYIAVAILALISIVSLIKRADNRRYFEEMEYAWQAVPGTKEGDLLVRGSKVDYIKGDINKLIYTLNRSDKDPELFRTPLDKEPTDPPKLKLKAIHEHVIDIEVINDEYLTQRMGSTGADIFLAVATFMLTEFGTITEVNFIFQEGDHAEPGIYSRQSFMDRWKVVR